MKHRRYNFLDALLKARNDQQFVPLWEGLLWGQLLMAALVVICLGMYYSD